MSDGVFQNTVLEARQSKGRGRHEVDGWELKSVLSLKDADLASAFARAALVGDVELAKILWERRGPFKAEIRVLPGEPTRFEILGEEGARPLATRGTNYISEKKDQYLAMLSCASDAEELFSLILKSGLLGEGNIDNAASLLFDADGISEATQRFSALGPQFTEEELPFLRNGVLENPEAAIAMAELQESRTFMRAYEHMLCWATPDMIDDFPNHLRPYSVSLELDYKLARALVDEPTQSGDYVTERVSEPLEVFRQGAARLLRSIKGLEDGKSLMIWHSFVPETLRCNVSPQDKNSLVDDLVLAAQASRAIRCGFGIHQGRVLCATSPEFLTSFVSAAPRESRLEAMRQRLANYFPLGIIHMEYAFGPESSLWLIPRHRDHFSGNYLIRTAGKCADFQRRIQQYLPDLLIERLAREAYGLQRSSLTFHPSEFQTLADVGLGHLPVRAELTAVQVEEMAKRGVKIPAGSKITVEYPHQNWKLPGLARDFYAKVASLGGEGGFILNGVNTGAPNEEHIGALRRIKDVLCSKDQAIQIRAALLLQRLPEELLPALRKPTDWVLAGKLFGDERIVPLLEREYLPKIRTSSEWNVMIKWLGHDPLVPYMHNAPDSTMTQQMSEVLEL
ncbi:hypothetical protein HNP46_000455 [Pseudomonas nitritireducens]|uniref:Uncharacterized protein n=1 Tax=Pseudomonas nitroreducens TaxID=46680 RepID=A0A7W7KF44_PSENT|nr:hypothetical protein [Pseudomonas nitritireducens]MBB4861644.1 hypothetical protein [Pseudomonas nitritireducens]